MKSLLAFSRVIDAFNERLSYVANWLVLLSCLISAGNARELANVIERAVVLSDHDTLIPEDFDIPEDDGVGALLAQGADGKVPLEQIERAYVRQVLEEHGGNKAGAARSLGINRRTLYRKLKE